MQKDLKIGLVLGLGMVIAAVLWLATRPSLSPQSEIADIPDIPAIKTPQESIALPAPAVAIEPKPEENQLPEENPLPPAAEAPPAELPDLTQYEQAEKIKTLKFHIVQKGETLSRISSQYYGSAGKWQKILEANRQTIKDANKLTPGMKLIIPD